MKRVVRGGQALVLLLPFFLVFIGDVQVPVSDSTATVPLAVLLIVPVLLGMLFKRQLVLSLPVVLLIGVLVFGAIGTALSPVANLARATAGALPVVFSALMLLAYSRSTVPYERAVRYMLSGGAVLATQVILLYFFVAIAQPGDYYDQKLLIETPLGRSNYLSAFLIFLVALSWPRNVFLSTYFALAVFCTMSRGGLLVLALLPVALLLSRRTLGLLGIGAVVLFGFVLSAVHNGGVDLLTRFIDSSDNRFDSTVNRLLLWAFGAELWSNHPFFGIAPNSFRTFVEQTDNIEDVWGVHNTILLLLLNYGVGGLLFYAAYLRLIYKAIVAAERLNRDFRVVRAAFIVLLVFGLFEPFVGSAAFEVLLTLIFVLARSAQPRSAASATMSIQSVPAQPRIRS